MTHTVSDAGRHDLELELERRALIVGKIWNDPLDLELDRTAHGSTWSETAMPEPRAGVPEIGPPPFRSIAREGKVALARSHDPKLKRRAEGIRRSVLEGDLRRYAGGRRAGADVVDTVQYGL